MENNFVITLIIAMGIPSLVASLGIWYLKKLIEKMEHKREKKEKDLCNFQISILKNTFAAMTLSEETIKAIRDKKTNGTVDKALEYANTVKKEQKEFMLKMGIENIYS